MSERALRKQSAETIARLLNRVQQDADSIALQKEALDLAHTALLEEPRTLRLCNFLVEFSPFNAVTFRTHCSECGHASIGYNEHWRFCPLCGSKIELAERESNPFDRNIRERVEFALQEKS